MSVESTLPVELYLPILDYIDDLASLAALCAVDRGRSMAVSDSMMHADRCENRLPGSCSEKAVQTCLGQAM